MSSAEILQGMRTPVLKKTSRGNLETTYNCAGFSVELKTCFQIDTSNDTADYPANFCKSCRLAMSKAKEAAEKKIPYKCMVKPYDWSLHCASTCKVKHIHMTS